MLLLKTLGGSSFIQLLSNSLRKDIPWFFWNVLWWRSYHNRWCASLSFRSTKSLKTELQLAYSTPHYSGETLRRLLNSLIQHFRNLFRKHSANNWILDTSRWWARIDITYMIFYSILFFTGFFDHLTLTYLLTTASKLNKVRSNFNNGVSRSE